MTSFWAKHFQFYEFLLTPEGFKQYANYYIIDALHQFDSTKDESVNDFKKHEILVKYHNLTYDENSLGRLFSLDLYVAQSALRAEQKAISDLDFEFRELFSEEDCKAQPPILLKYLTNLIASTTHSKYSYKQYLIESLERIVFHVRKTYKPSLSLSDSDSQETNQGILPKTYADLNFQTFQIRSTVRTNVPTILHQSLLEAELIDASTKVDDVRMVFEGIVDKKVNWIGSIGQLRYLIQKLIEYGFVETKARWQATVNSFLVENAAITEKQLHFNKIPTGENKDLIDSVVSIMIAVLPPKLSTSQKKNTIR